MLAEDVAGFRTARLAARVTQPSTNSCRVIAAWDFAAPNYPQTRKDLTPLKIVLIHFLGDIADVSSARELVRGIGPAR